MRDSGKLNWTGPKMEKYKFFLTHLQNRWNLPRIAILPILWAILCNFNFVDDPTHGVGSGS